MYKKLRQDTILEILKKQGYVTVDYLTKQLHYSTATINRDLNLLEKQQLIKRSYGGAELIKKQGVPLPFRYNKMRVEKRKIGSVAAKLIEKGDTVFIDGTTTTQSMAQHLTEIENIKIITNNMALATYLSSQGVNTVCLGGAVLEKPNMLYSNETVLNAKMYHANKMFFSTSGITVEGKISGGAYYLLHRAMADNSDKIYFLADHDKINVKNGTYLFDLNSVDCIISDYEFPQETKDKFTNTEFIYVE